MGVRDVYVHAVKLGDGSIGQSVRPSIVPCIWQIVAKGVLADAYCWQSAAQRFYGEVPVRDFGFCYVVRATVDEAYWLSATAAFGGRTTLAPWGWTLAECEQAHQDAADHIAGLASSRPDLDLSLIISNYDTISPTANAFMLEQQRLREGAKVIAGVIDQPTGEQLAAADEVVALGLDVDALAPDSPLVDAMESTLAVVVDPTVPTLDISTPFFTDDGVTDKGAADWFLDQLPTVDDAAHALRVYDLAYSIAAYETVSLGLRDG